ncbi:hypothetical protein [Halarchaeum nitratireducens]|uniref:Uncharacterized protein n=1 Tax=Halarchaeum nitratireducens TaxID=489913 RepID=A0A830G8M9_9EURY|nr:MULTISPECIES: hypothetical protein [Halarchaeum]MBP2250069.1 hypothetical protein [Halarchaeum solikamskense]GGN08696.1 hypothetical protein GCM10009021_05130 [Halarchaeum nitratireducens]
MTGRDLSPGRAAAAVAAAVVGLFALYFVATTLVPDLFGRWPRIGVGVGVGLAAACFVGCFAARARLSGPPLRRLVDAAVAAISALLLAQGVSFAVGLPLAVTADVLPLAFVHLLLWIGTLSTLVLVGTALRAIGPDLPDPAP